MAREFGPEGFLVPVVAGAAILLLGSAAVGFMNLHDQKDLWQQQYDEQQKNPAVFAISSPTTQPAGEVVASWTAPGYGSEHVFTIRFGDTGLASLSDTDTPSGATKRTAAGIVACSSLHLDTYALHRFTVRGYPFEAQLTANGNAAICEE